MEALFTHPLTMAAGAALVSAPIIIHLINRMRFRRIRWAAMEFLLKAQKRMRRKLIIEQLILLLLRCLLVFLVGMLLARFKWFSPLDNQDARSTMHVIVLDDTPSMADTEAKGDQRSAFDQAVTMIGQKNRSGRRPVQHAAIDLFAPGIRTETTAHGGRSRAASHSPRRSKDPWRRDGRGS